MPRAVSDGGREAGRAPGHCRFTTGRDVKGTQGVTPPEPGSRPMLTACLEEREPAGVIRPMDGNCCPGRTLVRAARGRPIAAARRGADAGGPRAVEKDGLGPRWGQRRTLSQTLSRNPDFSAHRGEPGTALESEIRAPARRILNLIIRRSEVRILPGPSEKPCHRGPLGHHDRARDAPPLKGPVRRCRRDPTNALPRRRRGAPRAQRPAAG